MASMYDSVDFDKVRGVEEALAITRIVPKIGRIKEQAAWTIEESCMEIFVITDHLDFLAAETFTNHQRRDPR